MNHRDPASIRPLEEEMRAIGLDPERTLNAMAAGSALLESGGPHLDPAGLPEGSKAPRSVHEVGRTLRANAMSPEDIEEAFKLIRKVRKTAAEKMQSRREYRRRRGAARIYAKQYYKRMKRKISKKAKRLRSRFGGAEGLKKARAGGKKRIVMAGLDLISNLRAELELAATPQTEGAEPETLSPYEEAAVNAGVLLMLLGEVHEHVNADEANAMFDLSDAAADLSEDLEGLEDITEELEEKLEAIIRGTAAAMRSWEEGGCPGVIEVIEANAIDEDIDKPQEGEEVDEAKKPKLGSGERFKKLSKELEKGGAEDPEALAAWIGRKKYGKGKMGAMAAKGRKEDVEPGGQDVEEGADEEGADIPFEGGAEGNIGEAMASGQTSYEVKPPQAPTPKKLGGQTFEIIDMRGQRGFPWDKAGLVYHLKVNYRLKDEFTGQPKPWKREFVIRTDHHGKGWRIDEVMPPLPSTTVPGLEAYYKSPTAAAKALSGYLKKIKSGGVYVEDADELLAVELEEVTESSLDEVGQVMESLFFEAKKGPKFKVGDIVRRTRKAMRSMGIVSGPVNGKVVGYSGSFPLIQWSDDKPGDEPMAQAEAGLELDKRAMARRHEDVDDLVEIAGFTTRETRSFKTFTEKMWRQVNGAIKDADSSDLAGELGSKRIIRTFMPNIFVYAQNTGQKGAREAMKMADAIAKLAAKHRNTTEGPQLMDQVSKLRANLKRELGEGMSGEARAAIVEMVGSAGLDTLERELLDDVVLTAENEGRFYPRDPSGAVEYALKDYEKRKTADTREDLKLIKPMAIQATAAAWETGEWSLKDIGGLTLDHDQRRLLEKLVLMARNEGSFYKTRNAKGAVGRMAARLVVDQGSDIRAAARKVRPLAVKAVMRSWSATPQQ